jgi:glycosyltransferase involved in cell wall biosynthesis
VGRLGINAEKIVTVPNGLIMAEHEARKAFAVPAMRSEYGIKDSDYLFLNVASYNLHKGHYLMVDAMRKILKVRNDIKILCIGNVINPAHVKELKRYLNNEGLDRHILMPGHFPNIESFYQISDAFLLPSFVEGWSIAMNEAMFYEKPMILTDTGAAAEVIENNDIGILLDNEYGDILDLNHNKLDDVAYRRREFRTSSILADAMMQFANNREYWQAAGRKGKEKLMRHYDFANTVDTYEKIFSQLC